MNVNRYVLASAIVFVYFFLIEYVFHGLILSGWYNEALHLLRPEAEATRYFPWMILGFLVLSFGFGYIFLKGYEDKGLGEGLRFGLYVGIAFSVSASLIDYAVFPFPGKWIVAWIIGYPVIMVFAGIIFSAIYRPKKS